MAQGERHVYYIERSWTAAEGNGVQELFKAEKDGKPLDDIVPARLARLFFFDGEKIKAIAEDITSNAAISDAIQTLLGLDTVKALQAELMLSESGGVQPKLVLVAPRVCVFAWSASGLADR